VRRAAGAESTGGGVEAVPAAPVLAAAVPVSVSPKPAGPGHFQGSQIRAGAPLPPPPVINVIPTAFSSEADQNSEPSIGVNLLPPDEMVISSFGTLPGRFEEPYFTTFNGGTVWSNFRVHDYAYNDTTVGWTTPGGKSYAAQLSPNGAEILVRSSLAPHLGEAYQIIPAGIISRATPGLDQPWINMTTAGGADHIYVGYNDLTVLPGSTKTANVWYSLNSGANWRNVTIDPVNPGLQNGPAVRVSASPNGNTVYVAQERFNAPVGMDRQADIVVQRSANGGADNFAATVTNVAAGITVPFDATALGHERLGSDLSVAVDPNNANVVYVAYAQVVAGQSQIQVMRSVNGGAAWAPVPLFTVNPDTGLPALAVAGNGALGMLYTYLDSANDLETRFIQAPADFSSSTDTLLEYFPDNTPAPLFDPYIGDYQGLVAVGNNFYGTFSASNDPNPAHFPLGVRFQRYVDFGAGPQANQDFGGPYGGMQGQLVYIDSTGKEQMTNVSIDPYFFTLPAAVSTNTDILWVGNDITTPVYRWRADGTFVGPWGRTGATGTALDGSGHVWTVQPGELASAITEYDANQNELRSFVFNSGIDNGNGYPSWIEDMKYAGNNTFWVSGYNGIVYHIDGNGQVLGTPFDTHSTYTGVATDGSFLYTTTGFFGDNVITQRDFNGNPVATITTGFLGMGGLGYDFRDNTFWAGFASGVLRKFDRSGNLLSSFTTPDGEYHDGVNVGAVGTPSSRWQTA
jgi:hypothetical protein